MQAELNVDEVVKERTMKVTWRIFSFMDRYIYDSRIKIKDSNLWKSFNPLDCYALDIP